MVVKLTNKTLTLCKTTILATKNLNSNKNLKRWAANFMIKTENFTGRVHSHLGKVIVMKVWKQNRKNRMKR